MPDRTPRADLAIDVLVAGVVGLLALAQTVGEARLGTTTDRVVVVGLVGGVQTAALVARRRAPVLVAIGTAVCAALIKVVAAHPATAPIAPAVALYTVAVQSGWRRATACAVGTLGLLAAVTVVRGGPGAPPVTQGVVFLGAATVVGLYVGSRAQVARALAARAEQLERERSLLAREAVLAERMWIARELHDSIGHHVSLLVVQAGAVRSTLPGDHAARPVLDSMIAGGKEAMSEMRRMVDVLRPVADDAAGTQDGFGPPPGLDHTPELCEQLRRGGLPVELELSPGADVVPRTASVTAYRIIQEALTNVVKHAGLVPTRVRVVRRGTLLDLRVTNGPGESSRRPLHALSTGHGHTGIRQRVALFNGRFFAGPVPDGGYAVQATLELEDRS